MKSQSNSSNQSKTEQVDSSPSSAEPVATKVQSKPNAALSPNKPTSSQMTVYSAYGYIEVARENYTNSEISLLSFTKPSSKFKGTISVSQLIIHISDAQFLNPFLFK